MTYNQIITEIRGILEGNPLIKTVKFAAPAEWINYGGNTELPIALFAIYSGTFDRGYQNTYAVKFWFLDRSGPDGEFENEVISDMIAISRDTVNALGVSSRDYSLQLPIQFSTLSEKFEDYLSGATFTAIIQTTGKSTFCDYPN